MGGSSGQLDRATIEIQNKLPTQTKKGVHCETSEMTHQVSDFLPIRFHSDFVLRDCFELRATDFGFPSHADHSTNSDTGRSIALAI